MYLSDIPVLRHDRVQGYIRRLLMPLGIDFYLKMDDRRVLETIILPYFRGHADYRRVLFIGSAWYTRGYRKYFAPASYWTLDLDPVARRYGARQHITDSMGNLSRHFADGSLDLIICNGVYGYGLDRLDDFDHAVDACHTALRENGLFILGWDDKASRKPFPLERSAALRRFRREPFLPLGTDHYVTANVGRHTFDFFTR